MSREVNDYVLTYSIAEPLIRKCKIEYIELIESFIAADLFTDDVKAATKVAVNSIMDERGIVNEKVRAIVERSVINHSDTNNTILHFPTFVLERLMVSDGIVFTDNAVSLTVDATIILARATKEMMKLVNENAIELHTPSFRRFGRLVERTSQELYIDLYHRGGLDIVEHK